MKKTLGTVLGVLLATGAVSAQTKWTADKAHSAVKFSVAHLVISSVDGRFKDFDASLESSKEDLTDAKITATIKTASIDTDNERRDAHLKSNDFLNAEKFPELKFASTKVEKTGAEAYKITGNLTIRDITRTVVLDTRLLGKVKDPWGNEKTAFKATTSIDRFEFGTTWNTAIEAGGLVAGKTVDITLNLQFTKAQPEQKPAEPKKK